MKHTMITETEMAKKHDLKNCVSAKALLLDLKALIKEYYIMTFTISENGNQAIISYNTLESYLITIMRTENKSEVQIKEMKKISYIYVNFIPDCNLKNYFSEKDLLLDIKALAKEYYSMTFLSTSNNQAEITFNNGQTFIITVTKT